MLTKIAIKVTNNLIENHIISKEDFELYSFGLKSSLIIAINIIVTLIIGFSLRMPIESLLILVVFIPLRSCAGGIHASNNTLCLFISALMIVSILIFTKWLLLYFTLNLTLMTVVGLVAAVITFILAPVQDANKPLNANEAQLFKKRTLKVLFAEISFLIIMLCFRIDTVVLVIALTLCIVCLSVCAGAVKNMIDRKFISN